MKNTRDVAAWFITFEDLAIREGLCPGHIDHNTRAAGRRLFDQGYNAGAAVAKLKLDQEKLSKEHQENEEIYRELTERGNSSDSTALFFPTRNEIKYSADAQEKLSDRIGTPLKVQELEVSRHGYEGWDTYAVRTRENYCLAVVGEVDRATSGINKQAAHLFAEAPALLSELKNLFEGYAGLHDGLSAMIEDGRLQECDIPDDYRWLADKLEALCSVSKRSEDLFNKLSEVSK